MNRVILIGRLTKDPEMHTTQGDRPISIARYSLAVDRRFKKDGEQNVDFINCVTFGKGAEFVERFFHKGMRVAVQGRIQINSYEKEGRRIYTTDIVVEDQEFVESKKREEEKGDDDFMTVPDGIDEELPFH